MKQIPKKGLKYVLVGEKNKYGDFESNLKAVIFSEERAKELLRIEKESKLRGDKLR
jgi:hypothetical protein